MQMDYISSDSTSITKLDIKGKSLYVKVMWKGKHDLKDFFHIKIFDGDITWSGRLSNEIANKYRERFEETDEKYKKSVEKCLRESENGEFSYDFAISLDDSNSATFTWKKRFEDSVHGFATLVYGTVTIHRDTEVESKDILLDFLLAENRDLKSTISSLSAINEGMLTDLKKSKTELEKLVDLKSSLESNLYGKFVQLLNNKKRRIQVLEEGLQEYANSREFIDSDKQ